MFYATFQVLSICESSARPTAQWGYSTPTLQMRRLRVREVGGRLLTVMLEVVELGCKLLFMSVEDPW